MSLNDRERAATAREFAENLALSGLTVDEAARLARCDVDRFTAALHLTPGADPRDVWVVRDILERAALDAGHTPVPYSKLQENMRSAAGVWFGVPPRD